MVEVPNKLYIGYLEYQLGDFLFHHRSKNKKMVEDGLFYTSNALKKMALRSEYKINVKRYAVGPVVPLYKYFKFIDRIIPHQIRNIFGGGAGIEIKKCT